MADRPTVSHVANEQLREKYSELRASGYLGGAMFFHELERLAWTSFDAESSDRRLICFVLASVFDGLAKRQELAGAVTADFCARLHDVLDQPIIECIDILASRSGTPNRLEAAFRLIDAYARARGLDPAR
ncbi:MAG: hypothetical protein Q8P46_06530 [Hyphomicrobiales bacterium]|nr:hypothetical protein [Hyphomicrobiales bacterium]